MLLWELATSLPYTSREYIVSRVYSSTRNMIICKKQVVIFWDLPSPFLLWSIFQIVLSLLITHLNFSFQIYQYFGYFKKVQRREGATSLSITLNIEIQIKNTRWYMNSAFGMSIKFKNVIKKILNIYKIIWKTSWDRYKHFSKRQFFFVL